MKSALVAENLRFGWGDRSVLRSISLRMDEPGLTLILGPNGSGKSTLLRVLAGLLTPREGHVELDGIRLTEMGAPERARKLGWLSQTYHGSLPWPLRDFVRMGRFAHRRSFEPAAKEDEEAITEALSTLRLDHLQDRTLETLSGGERQLARIARILAQRTAYLLLDEPFTALDIRHRADLWAELIKPTRAVLAVTHDLSLIGPGCKRLILLKEGSVVADGRPEEVLTPSHLQNTFGWAPPPGWRFETFQFGSS